MLETKLEKKLLVLKHKNQFRVRKKNLFLKKKTLQFRSNDFLGLATHPDIINAGQNALQKYGISTCSSSLVSGYTELHQDLEQRLARFLGFEASLLFSSGYLANLAAVSSSIHRHDRLFLHQEAHASLIDACLLTQCKFNRFHTQKNIKSLLHYFDPLKINWLITEGVFSMSGEMEDFSKIFSVDLTDVLVLSHCQDTVTNQNGFSERSASIKSRLVPFELIIDDAVGVGVLGEHGQGTLEHQGIRAQDVTLLTGTFAKAFGGSGGFVLGSKAQIENLIQSGRSYIYNSALSPIHVAANIKALEMIQQESWRRKKLQQLIDYFQKQAHFYGIPFACSQTPIQVLILGDNASTMNLADFLEQKDILVSGIRPPSVAEKQSRIRICLTAAHEQADIDKLFAVLKHYFLTKVN